MQLANGEFAINGYRFGCGHPVSVSSVQATNIKWRVQDQPNPVGNTILLGRDFKDPQPIKLGIFTKSSTPEEEFRALAEFAEAWSSAANRAPGEESVLEIGAHGRTFRAYGRPRDLDVEDTELFARTHAEGTAIFDRSDALFYGDPDHGGGGQVTLSITPPQAAGLVFPIVFPWATLTGGQRQGIVTNTGTRQTGDVTITITGPIDHPIVTGKGWTLDLDATLLYDQTVTINARARTVRRNDGTSLAGKLSRNSRLDRVVVPPGSSEFTFRGTDQTGSATATIRWGSAHTTLGA